MYNQQQLGAGSHVDFSYVDFDEYQRLNELGPYSPITTFSSLDIGYTVEATYGAGTIASLGTETYDHIGLDNFYASPQFVGIDYTGEDHLYGESGDDELFGDEGNNNIAGGLGDDRLFGWVGEDLLEGDEGSDTLFGQAGDDDLFGGVGDDELYGDDGNDRLFGQADNDRLFGWTGDDELYGDDGNDVLFGQAGSDLLLGWLGDDILVGGAGFDLMDGQGGSDEYVFELGDLSVGGSDRILSYEETDTYTFLSINLSQIFTYDFAGGAAFNIELAPGQFHYVDVMGASASQLQAKLNDIAPSGFYE